MKLPVLFLVVFMPVCYASASGATNPNDIERLLDAIACIESQCIHNAVGDGGRALGVYQIHLAYWKDGTKFLGVDWPHHDATDPKKAQRVVKAYLLHYGKGKSLLDMARIHNGGPRGYRKKATLPYTWKILAKRCLLPGLYCLLSSDRGLDSKQRLKDRVGGPRLCQFL